VVADSAPAGGVRVQGSPLDAAMRRAMAFARRSFANGSYPVGAVIVAPGSRIVGGGANRTQATGVPTDHAEMGAIRRARPALAAAAPGELTLVTTGEPCLMCVGAILQTPAIGTVVWAVGPVSPAGSAIAAVRASGYNAERLARLTVIPEPSAEARSASARLLYRWCVERGDPRAGMFAAAAGVGSEAEPATGAARRSRGREAGRGT
jgi:tRNA(adenine34) deaminase